jgi:hypothetical protein
LAQAVVLVPLAEMVLAVALDFQLEHTLFLHKQLLK